MNPLNKMRVRNFFLGVGGQLGFSLSPYGQERQDQAQQEVYESSEHPQDGFTFIGKGNEKLKVESCRVAITAQNRTDSVTTTDDSNTTKEGNNESSSVFLQSPQETHTAFRETSQESVRTVISPSLSFTDFKSYSDAGLSRLNILNSLLTIPQPSSADIKASADVLSNISEKDAAEILGGRFPGLLDSLQLTELRRDPEQFSAVLSKATESLTKRKWIDIFNKNVEIYSEEGEELKREIKVLPQELLDSYSTWDTLTEQYNCSICQDVKAAPVVLSCEHNFCFACIEAHKNSCCIQDSPLQHPSRSRHDLFEEDIVVHKCPNCKMEITQDGLYERDLDETIFQLVGKIADIDPVTGEDLSERKAAYHERREVHKNAMRIKRQQQQQQQQKGQEGQKQTDADSGSSNNSGYDWCLPIVIIALIALIVVLRH